MINTDTDSIPTGIDTRIDTLSMVANPENEEDVVQYRAKSSKLVFQTYMNASRSFSWRVTAGLHNVSLKMFSRSYRLPGPTPSTRSMIHGKLHTTMVTS